MLQNAVRALSVFFSWEALDCEQSLPEGLNSSVEKTDSLCSFCANSALINGRVAALRRHPYYITQLQYSGNLSETEDISVRRKLKGVWLFFNWHWHRLCWQTTVVFQSLPVPVHLLPVWLLFANIQLHVRSSALLSWPFGFVCLIWHTCGHRFTCLSTGTWAWTSLSLNSLKLLLPDP